MSPKGHGFSGTSLRHSSRGHFHLPLWFFQTVVLLAHASPNISGETPAHNIHPPNHNRMLLLLGGGRSETSIRLLSIPTENDEYVQKESQAQKENLRPRSLQEDKYRCTINTCSYNQYVCKKAAAGSRGSQCSFLWFLPR